MKCTNSRCKDRGKEVAGDRATCPTCGCYLDPKRAQARNQRSRAKRKAEREAAGGTGASGRVDGPMPETAQQPMTPPGPAAPEKPKEDTPAPVDKAAEAEAFPSWDTYKAAKDQAKAAAPAAPAKPALVPWVPPVRLICIELNKFLEPTEQLKDDEITQLEAAAGSLGLVVQPREGEPIVLPWWAPVLAAVAVIVLPRAPKLIASALRKWKAHQAEQAAKKAAEKNAGA